MPTSDRRDGHELPRATICCCLPILFCFEELILPSAKDTMADTRARVDELDDGDSELRYREGY